jgi:hypothetical protein
MNYAASTAFLIAGAVWLLRWRRPRANCSLRMGRGSSISAMVVAAQSRSLKPSIGPVPDLIPRSLCSIRLLRYLDDLNLVCFHTVFAQVASSIIGIPIQKIRYRPDLCKQGWCQ